MEPCRGEGGSDRGGSFSSRSPAFVTIVIRSYRREDCDAVLDVWARASAMAHPFLGENFLDEERRNIREVYLPRAETWVWEVDGRVVGYIALLESEVGALFVDPAFHRRGIGRTLIERARALRGELQVEVFERNLLGRAFYASVGFELVRREIHDPTGLVMLRLRLASDAP